MACRALCVGINDYPGLEGDLRGCVNDATAWARLLVDHYGFPAGSVRLLLNEEATRREILAQLDRMLRGARPGDVLVFTNSSHGTYVPDGEGGHAEEALCPYDYRSNLILDDELHERFRSLKAGVQLVFLSDSCHSGRVSRFSPAGEYRCGRFLAPEEWGGTSISDPQPRLRQERYPDGELNEILLAGCRPHQYAFDARVGATYHGAMTGYALQAIREHGYDLTYADLHARLVELLADAGFEQAPRLEARDDDSKRRLFS